jgi:hypothetical protein
MRRRSRQRRSAAGPHRAPRRATASASAGGSAPEVAVELGGPMGLEAADDRVQEDVAQAVTSAAATSAVGVDDGQACALDATAQEPAHQRGAPRARSASANACSASTALDPLWLPLIMPRTLVSAMTVPADTEARRAPSGVSPDQGYGPPPARQRLRRARTAPAIWRLHRSDGQARVRRAGSRRRLSATALSATMMLEPAMEMAPTSGRRTKPSGSKTPAATGRARLL